MVYKLLEEKQPMDNTKKAENYKFLSSEIHINGELINYNKSIHGEKLSNCCKVKLRTILN